jgi:hypothetical protein
MMDQVSIYTLGADLDGELNMSRQCVCGMAPCLLTLESLHSGNSLELGGGEINPLPDCIPSLRKETANIGSKIKMKRYDDNYHIIIMIMIYPVQ